MAMLMVREENLKSSKINYDGTGIVSSSKIGIFIEKGINNSQITLIRCGNWFEY